MTAEAARQIAFVTFACRKDVHYAKALLGSIRHFYPEHTIHVVLDDVPFRDERQMEGFPGAVIHRVEELVRQHSLPLRGLLAKLNVFFLPGVAGALVADADSILAGPVLDVISPQVVVHSLNTEMHDRDVPGHVETFDRWAIDLEALARREGKALPPRYPFVQGSHFFVDVARFPCEILRSLLPEMGETHQPTHMLRAGDQGFWNYLANFGEALGVPCAQSPVTIQVGHPPHIAAYDDVEFLMANRPKPYYFIHYVGFSRRYLRRQHEYAAALAWGTRLYYRRVGGAAFARDELARLRDTVARGVRKLQRGSGLAAFA